MDEGRGVADLPHAEGEVPRSLAKKAAVMARASLLECVRPALSSPPRTRDAVAILIGE